MDQWTIQHLKQSVDKLQELLLTQRPNVCCCLFKNTKFNEREEKLYIVILFFNSKI